MAANKIYLNQKKDDVNTDIIVYEYASEIVKKTFELYATGAFSTDRNYDSN
ncbi:MAG: hypothetical protein WCS92_02440 [Candidatus Babeliales bacterium]|jgi:hypothetical protein